MKRTLLVCTSLAALYAGAAAAEGFYISGSAGGAFLESSSNTSGPAFDIDGDYDPGWVARGAFGYGFANGLRAEAEFGYRRNDWTQLRIRRDGGLGRSLGIPPLDGATVPVTGTENALTFMTNGWYDIKTGTPFTPYVGGGIGAARVSIEGLSAGGGLTLVEDHDWVFAYQLGAGLSYAVTQSLSLTVDYRFFATTDPRFTDFEGVSFDSDYRSHTLSAGFRFSF
jgi:opacity protein-like surface antigen